MLLGLSDASPAQVHVTLQPTRVRRAVPRHLVVHYADLPPGDVQAVEGISVTTPERTIRDVHADHVGRALVRQAIEDGGRTGHLTLEQADRLARELSADIFSARATAVTGTTKQPKQPA